MRELMKAFQEYKHTKYVVVPWHLRAGENHYAYIALGMAEGSLLHAFERQ